jgi:hypothetical protein
MRSTCSWVRVCRWSPASAHRAVDLAGGHGFLDGAVDLTQLAIDVGYDSGLYRNPAVDVGQASCNGDVALDLVPNVSPDQESIIADRIETHQHGDQDDEAEPHAV